MKLITDRFLARMLVLLTGICSSMPALTRAADSTTPAPATRPTVFVVGDSTARNTAKESKGWGDSLAAWFDGNKAQVVNRAMAGRSTRTFISEGRWDKVLQEMKPGDFVLIQFGHNDGGPVDTGRARASLPGLGEETKEITKTDGSTELVHTYGWYLRKMIADTRARGATPILMSLTLRNIWKGAKVERGSGQFGQWIAETAKAQGVPFVDLTNIAAGHYERMGQEKVKTLYSTDYVHTSPAGADLNAQCVIEGLRALPVNPLAELIKTEPR